MILRGITLARLRKEFRPDRGIFIHTVAVALVGIVAQATIFVVPYDHPDFTSNALSEDLFSFP